MLQFSGDEITGFTITGNGLTDYARFLPLTHESGIPYWILNPAGEVFEDTDGTSYHVKKRTLAEIQAMPQYQAWVAAQAIDAAQSQAKTDFSTFPAWMKTFTAAQAEAYIETNVTTLQTAKNALKVIARMLVLMRNHTRFTE